VNFTYRDLLKELPGLEELKQLAGMGGIDLKGLVNTRSQAFKKLRPPLPDLDEAGVAELIQQEPRIMVRPILVVGQKLAIGFKEEEYQRLWPGQNRP